MFRSDGAELIQAGRVAHHVHGHDGLGAGRDLVLHILRIEVQGAIHLGQHRHSPGVDDGRDAGDKGKAGHDDLVAGPDPQPHQGRQEGCGARVDGQRVAHLRAAGHLLLELEDLALEAGVLADLVAIEVARPQDVHDLPDLFLTYKFHPWSRHYRQLLTHGVIGS